MESLYVCLFSNGHIKVGRSVDYAARIKQHAERVSCLGVSLTDYFVSERCDQAERRERELINRCANAASARFQSEWFQGLAFSDVAIWAAEASRREIEAVECAGHLREYLQSAGSMSVSQLREAMNSLGADLRDDAQLRQWIAVNGDGNFRRQPGAAYAMYLERATGGKVTRQAMRPDDYAAIWPELARIPRPKRKAAATH